MSLTPTPSEGPRDRIKAVLRENETGEFITEALALLAELGYRSDRTLPDQPRDVSEFIKTFPARRRGTQSERELLEQDPDIRILFQVTDTEINFPHSDQQGQFNLPGVDTGDARSFLFVTVELRADSYPRHSYAQITREINKRFRMPTVVLFRTARGLLTLAFVHRRAHRRDPQRDVLGNVSLIREINPTDPHRAHLDILEELSLSKRIAWMESRGKARNFDGLLEAWLDALDTEELNKRFYRELFDWFLLAVKEARFPITQARTLPPEEHVIRLITRLLFIWFIKEKGLVADDLFIKERIEPLLESYDQETGDSYYRAVLQNLFFATLNTEIGRRGFSEVKQTTHRSFSLYRYRDEMSDPKSLIRLFNETPFINGGLFDCLDSEESTTRGGYRIDCFSDNLDHRGLLSIPNRLFFGPDGLIDMFNRYRFTVEENTPTEQEVALDPELLGRVFENLLAAYNPETRETARKQTGSYYTPRQVVDYMVDEALVASLSTGISPHDEDTDFWKERLHYLFDHADAFDDAEGLFTPEERESIIRSIAEIKIIDPAVGSGAFPMAILHKLTLALRRLDQDNQLWESLQKRVAADRASSAFDTTDQDERDAELKEISYTFEKYRSSDFGRKLYLIQNSIFGVDIQPIACQIAKLRFFISLAIEQVPDFDAENFGIKPLPNLETRFVAADTLIGLESQQSLSSAKALRFEHELHANRQRHFHATTRQQKLVLSNESKKLRADLSTELQVIGMPAEDAARIANWDPYDQNSHADWFDTGYMFGIRGGFHIVIGNPPYAKIEHLPRQVRDRLKLEFGWLGDLYEHFIFRGMELVSDRGIFTYICSDSFITLSTKQKIRNLIFSNTLLHLVKTPTHTFEASIYTAIFLLIKQASPSAHEYVSGQLTGQPDYTYEQLGLIPYSVIKKLPYRQFLLSKEINLLLRLLEYEKLSDYCRILDTGIDSGNVRYKLFYKENHDNINLSRIIQGKQIGKYFIDWESPQANYKFCDINYQPLPIFGRGRGGKPSKRLEYWSFRGSIDNHHQPERLLMRQTDDDLILAYHSEELYGQFYTDNTLFTILSHKINLKFLLALLNSNLLNYIYHSISQEKGKSQAQVKVKVVRLLPVIVPSLEPQSSIVELVDEILLLKLADPTADTNNLESEIDQLIYNLYDLSAKDVMVVEEG